MTPRQPVRSAVVLLVLALAGCSGNRGANTTAAQLQFGVDMARRGLWQEALFRFLQAERMEPGNPRVYNNLAVAYEANGEFDKALEYYQKALRAAPDNREARGNYARFVEFYQAFKPKAGEEAKPPAQPASRREGEGQAPESVPNEPPAAPPHQPAATPEAKPQEPPDMPPPPPTDEPPAPPPPAPRTA